ncbi:DUF4365 domain-containing protein [Vibrio splendidus]
MKNQELVFKLPIKNYNDLREVDDLPKILIVVFCPKDHNEWVSHTCLKSEVRFSGYWTCIQGFPAVNNGTKVTVRIPFSQFFSNVSLIELMEKYSARGLGNE